jgi:hypothetical protein
MQRDRQFDTDLVMQYDAKASRALDKDYWRVLHSFTFTIDDNGEQAHVVIPAGYLTDGASVPRMFWWLLPPWGKYGQAAVVHDLLCERRQLIRGGQTIKIERSHADWLFREAMKEAGVQWIKRTIMYAGVRFFTGLHMHLNRKRYAKKAILEQQWSPEAAAV